MPPTIAVNTLPKDVGNRYFAGPWDEATDSGLAWRGSNSDGVYADGNVVLYDASGNPIVVQAGGNDGEANVSNHLRTAARQQIYNGSTWDRRRNNDTGTALSLAARTGTAISVDITNFNARGVMLFLRINTTPNNAETLTLALVPKDPVGGGGSGITAFTAIVASSLGAAPGVTYAYTIYPGAVETAATNFHEVQGLPIPRTWNVVVTHSAGGSWTYSVGYSHIQ